MSDTIVTSDAGPVKNTYPNTVAKAALWWLERGIQPVPLCKGKKFPREDDWQTTQLTPADVPRFFRTGENLGVRLDSWLVDLDLDSQEALALAPDFLPETGWISGRQGKPRSHWWYRADRLKLKKFADSTGGRCFLELRAGKNQTVVPPSILYVDGVFSRCAWDTWTDRGAAVVAGEELPIRAGRLAAAALLLRVYPRHASYRHDLALALAGGLVHGGWEEDQVSHFIRAIAGAAGDEEIANRLAGVWTSFRRLEREQPAQGWTTLAKILTDHGQPGRAVVQSVRQWLGLDVTRAAANGPTDTGPTVAAGGGWDNGPPEDGPPDDEPPSEGSPGGGGGGPEGRRESKKSQASRLVELALAADLELYHTPEERTYARIPRDGHVETKPLATKAFRSWLRRLFRTAEGKSIGPAAVAAALDDLDSIALFDGEEVPLHLRVAEHNGALYLDLGNSAWEAVEIRPSGWRVIQDPPVHFRRSPGMQALPTPERGGRLDDLLPFLPNLTSNDSWLLLQGWLLSAFRQRGPYPILHLRGEQGAGKSTVGRVLQRLIDPNAGDLRAEPREVRDLMIAANNCWMIAYDNLSALPTWLSDALCRLSTGGGFGTRELYTNEDEILFTSQRPGLLTSITDVLTAPDLLDRALPISLVPLEEEQRRTEEEFWAAFDQAHPTLLGALLDAVCAGLRTLPATRLPRLPRMADFARWAEACCRGLGEPANAFLEAFATCRAETNSLALDGSPVAAVLLGARSSLDGFLGTASALLTELNTLADEKVQKQKHWPTSANYLTNLLRRIAPNLRTAGILVTFLPRLGKQGQKRLSINYLGGDDHAPPPPAADDPPKPPADDPPGPADDRLTIPPETIVSHTNPCVETPCDDIHHPADDADDDSHNISSSALPPPADDGAGGGRPPSHYLDKEGDDSGVPPAESGGEKTKCSGNHRQHRQPDGVDEPNVVPPKNLRADDGEPGGSSADRQPPPRDRQPAEWRETPHGRYLYVTSPEQLPVVEAAVGEASWVALDTETVEQEPMSWRTAEVRLLQLALLGSDGLLSAFILDARCLGQAALATVLSLLSRKELLVHNGEFDLPRLVKLGMPLPTGPIQDSLIHSRLLTAGTKWSNALDAVVKRHLGIELDKSFQTSAWGAAELTAEQLSYAARDVLLLPAVDEKLQLALAAANLGEVAAIERRCAPAWQWLTVSGLPVERGKWEVLAEKSAADRVRLAEELAAAAPARPGRFGGLEQWNFSSNQQVLEILHLLGFTGVTATRDETLATLDHPWVKSLRDYRSAQWLDGTYGADFLRFVDPVTGRIYATWRQMGNEAGRTSCKEPNLQQIPRDKAYRQAFVAPPGRVLVKADYSAAHLRIVAALAPEPRMVEAFQNGLDLHKLTAASLLGKKVEDIPDKGPGRQLAKAVNFGLLYGMGPQTLQATAEVDYGVTLTLAEARRYRAKFFEAYPGIRAWHERTAAARASQAETRTLANRRRLLDHKTPLQHRLNSPVLGTEGDGAKLALALLWERRADCPSAIPVAFVHDEIVVECDVRDREAAACWLRRAMEDGLAPLIAPVPVVVEVQWGATWAG